MGLISRNIGRLLLSAVLLAASYGSAFAGVLAESRNFRFVSEVDIDAGAYLEDLEALRHAVLTDLGLPTTPEREPLTISIFDDPELFDRVSPGGQTAAVYLRSAIGDDIVIGYSSQRKHLLRDALEPAWLRLVLRHESVHHIFETHYDRKIPIWLSEGLAEYYSTFRQGPNSWVEFGEPFPEQDPLSERAKWLPMRTVIESLSSYPQYKGRDRDDAFRSQRLYYGQSWALAHFVLDQPEGLAAIHRFVDGWPQYGDSEDSFEDTFGLRYDRLELEMRDRIGHRLDRVKRFQTALISIPRIETWRIKDEVVQQNALRLLMRFGRLDEETDADVERRRKHLGSNANHPDLVLSRGLREWRKRNWVMADFYIKQVLDGVRNASYDERLRRAKALKLRAKSAYGRVSEDQTNEPLWKTAEEAVDKALSVQPNDPSLHLFRVAVTLPEKDGLPRKARHSLDWLMAENVRLSKPHEAMMMVPALIYEREFDRADAVLDNAARWTEKKSDQLVIERLRSNVRMERANSPAP